MFKIFQMVIRYLGNLPIKPVNADDRLMVFPSHGVPKHTRVSDIMPFAHVSFDGDANILSSFNVLSVNRVERGVFRVTFSVEHTTGKYTLISTSGSGNHTSSGRTVSVDEMTSTTCTVRIERTDTGSQENEPYTALVIF